MARVSSVGFAMWALACCVLCFAVGSSASRDLLVSHGEQVRLNSTCASGLQNVLQQYNGTVDVQTMMNSSLVICNATCQITCRDGIIASLNDKTRTQQRCLSQRSLMDCFNVARRPWLDFMRRCELFSSQFAATAVGGEGEGEGEGEGAATGGGCFPDFKTATDFELFLDGRFNATSGAAGLRASGALALAAAAVGAVALLAL